MSMKGRIQSFFGSARQYVVVGASKNPSKFGFKILLWYVGHDLSVIPVNPKEKEILGQEAAQSLSDVVKSFLEKKDVGMHKLKECDGLSISFLTPPNVTKVTLEQLGEISGYKSAIKGLWFQPGSYDESVLEETEKLGLQDKVIHEDECILVRGEEGLYRANL